MKMRSAARAKQTHQTREMKELMLRNAFTFVEHVVFLLGPQNSRPERQSKKLEGFESVQSKMEVVGIALLSDVLIVRR